MRFLASASLALVLASCSSDSSKKGNSNTPDGAAPGAPDSSTPTGADAAHGDGGGSFAVTTKSGVVLGKPDGTVRAFYGIPYAAPPTGPNRWRAPQPVAQWTTPRDATAAPPVCPQIAAGGAGADPRSNEDCLVLNVWTPNPPPSAPVPVMVWIHGGSFIFGSGGETYYDGGHLVDEGKVIVVGINYRLGPLGFLAHPALTAEDAAHPTSGNYGFEDQQAALRWVKDNIAGFGGDPTQVTLFGESAGGYSVCAHLVAPGSAGLFSRAISESGLCSGLTNTSRAEQYANGEAIARAAGCTDSANVLECLRGKATTDFFTIFSASSQPGGLFFQGPRPAGDAGATDATATFGPVKDGVDIPVNIADVGTGFAKVPLLLGTNLNEGALFSSAVPFGGTPVTSESEYEAAVTRTFGVIDATFPAQLLAKYPASAFPSPNDALNELATDAFFACPARRLARNASGAGVDVYLYSFAHVPEKPITPGLGVFHSAELGFVFGTDFPLALPQPDEQPLGTVIRGYWTRFAHAGDPNGAGSPTWPKYTAASDEDLKLDLPAASTETARKKAICDFWDTVPPPT